MCIYGTRTFSQNTISLQKFTKEKNEKKIRPIRYDENMESQIINE